MKYRKIGQAKMCPTDLRSAVYRPYNRMLLANTTLYDLERGFIKRGKVRYTDEPIGKIKIIPNFLPSPDKLVLEEETVKVTLLLTKDSVDFFKHEAEQQHVQYKK